LGDPYHAALSIVLSTACPRQFWEWKNLFLYQTQPRKIDKGEKTKKPSTIQRKLIEL
jgi:hypothetical protein